MEKMIECRYQITKFSKDLFTLVIIWFKNTEKQRLKLYSYWFIHIKTIWEWEYVLIHIIPNSVFLDTSPLNKNTITVTPIKAHFKSNVDFQFLAFLMQWISSIFWKCWKLCYYSNSQKWWNFIASKMLEIKSRRLTWVGPKRKSMPWLWFKTRFAFVNKMLIVHNLFKFTCNTHFKRPKVWRFTISIPCIMVSNS